MIRAALQDCLTKLGIQRGTGRQRFVTLMKRGEEVAPAKEAMKQGTHPNGGVEQDRRFSRTSSPSIMSGPRGLGLALLGYSALVLLLFHELIGQLSTAVPHDVEDPLLSTWILWWNAHHLPFVGAWWDGLSFFPGHGSLAFSDHSVGLELIAGPVQWLGGTPILAYNVTLLSSLVL